MTYTQNAETGGTGARPIADVFRIVERRLARQAPSAASVTLDRSTVLRALEGAARPLGLSEGEFATLRVLVLATRDTDWQNGARLMAWPSNQYLATDAGKSVSTIKNRVRRLRLLGLVRMHDSANGKRRGTRSRSGGAITEAYGFDLAPLRDRYAELLELGIRHKVEIDMLKTGQRRLSAACRLVGQVMAQAAERMLTGPEWPALRASLDAHVAEARAARRRHDIAAFDVAIDAAETLRTTAIELADRLIYELDIDPKGSKNDPHIYLQTDPSIMNVQAGGERSRVEGLSSLSKNGSPQPGSNGMVPIKTSPGELVELFPAAAQYVSSKTPDWDDACRGAARLGHDLGIRRDTYIEAVSLLGREGAALALFITAERDARNEIRLTAGCYFAGMTERARTGQLDLNKSLWGFRKAVGGM
jgi:replication initiation protein RepC